MIVGAFLAHVCLFSDLIKSVHCQASARLWSNCPKCFQETCTVTRAGHKSQRMCGSLFSFILPLCLDCCVVLLFLHSEHGSKANSYSFRIWGRLWLKETSPIKEEGEEKGIHLIQNDWRGRNHSYLIIDAFHTISVILREECLSHPQP